MSCPHPALVALTGACPICATNNPGHTTNFLGDAPLPNPLDLLRAASAPISATEKVNATDRQDKPAEPEPAEHEYEPTPEEVAEYREDVATRAAAELARRRENRMRRSLASFLKGSWGVRHGAAELEWGPHLQLVCDTVQRWFEGWLGYYVNEWDTSRDILAPASPTPLHVQDMLFNLAPGTLKSEIIMVTAPAWLWLHEPSAKFGCISGNPDNVTRDSNACRDLVTSPWYRETFHIDWEVRDDVDAVGKWATCRADRQTLGERTSRGMSASSVGLHVDILLCDDPDDAHKVHSAAARKDVKSQWSALGSRLNSMERSLRGVVQQRLHADDLSSTLLAQGWPALVLRAQYHAAKVRPTPWDPRPDWRTEEGESLHPARLTPAVFAAEKLRLGSAGFAAQYNQDPEPEGGNMLKRSWWRFFRCEDRPAPEHRAERPDGCTTDAPVVLKVRRDARGKMGTRRGLADYELDRMYITVDATFGSMAATASRVGIAAVGVRGADRFVFVDRSRKMTYPETRQAIRDMVAEFGADAVLVEKKANGAAVIADLEHEISGLIAIEPRGGKESRAAAWSPSVEAGNWYLLDGAHWVDHGHDDDDDGFMVEQSTFPNGKRDDRIDMLSQLEAHERESSHGQRLKNGWKW